VSRRATSTEWKPRSQMSSGCGRIGPSTPQAAIPSETCSGMSDGARWACRLARLGRKDRGMKRRSSPAPGGRRAVSSTLAECREGQVPHLDEGRDRFGPHLHFRVAG
jgi:hypothetical protein